LPNFFFYKKDLVQKLSNFTGIENLDYFNIWIIADHILSNQGNNIPLAQWEIDNYAEIIKAYDYSFNVEFRTDEMGFVIFSFHISS